MVENKEARLGEILLLELLNAFTFSILDVLLLYNQLTLDEDLPHDLQTVTTQLRGLRQ